MSHSYFMGGGLLRDEVAVRFCLSSLQCGYLASLRLKKAECGECALTYTTTRDREDRLTFCTKAAALSVLVAIEQHKKTDFQVCEAL